MNTRDKARAGLGTRQSKATKVLRPAIRAGAKNLVVVEVMIQLALAKKMKKAAV